MERLREIVGEPDQSNGAPAPAGEGLNRPASAAASVTCAGERNVHDVYCHELSDVRIGWSGCAIAILSMFVVSAWIVITSRMLPQVPPVVRGIMIGIPIAGIVAGFMLMTRRSELRGLEKLLAGPDGGNPVNTFIAIATGTLFINENNVLSRATSHYATSSFTGNVFRLWKKPKPQPITPLHVTFEPMLIDESNPGFRELAESPGSSLASSQSATPTHTFRESILPPAVQRNIRLRGGYPIVLMGLLFLGIGVIEWVTIGQPSFNFAFWSLWFLMLLCFPARNNKNYKQQWLMLPGGLLLRTAAKRGMTDLHLFDAARSIMLCVHSRYRLWTIHVSDGQQRGWLSVTPIEMDIILRAWCSPIKPPTVEQLSDFA